MGSPGGGARSTAPAVVAGARFHSPTPAFGRVDPTARCAPSSADTITDHGDRLDLASDYPSREATCSPSRTQHEESSSAPASGHPGTRSRLKLRLIQKLLRPLTGCACPWEDDCALLMPRAFEVHAVLKRSLFEATSGFSCSLMVRSSHSLPLHRSNVLRRVWTTCLTQTRRGSCRR